MPAASSGRASGPLVAVAGSPFPRPDGTLVEAAGYDAHTGVLLRPTIDFPSVPSSPDREQAERAWDRLKEYVADFPFEGEDDRAVFLAGLLTVIARPAIDGPVPGIAVIGNRAGTGKGLLIDVMAIPDTGRPVPASSYPDDTAEAAKVKTAIALGGDPVVHFDNLAEGSAYGNSALDSALTARETNERLLGGNARPVLPLRPAWFLSGNNLAPASDAYRRWLVCNLVTPLEHPEGRTDLARRDLLLDVIHDRGSIVRDALTILRAHSLAGRPDGGWGRMGSFENWDEVVRGAVWYATARTPWRPSVGPPNRRRRG